MKNRIIAIGNKIYCRLDKRQARRAYNHGYDILQISRPGKTVLRPWGLEWYVLNRDSKQDFDNYVDACTLKNPAFYVQLDNVKTLAHKIVDARAKAKIVEIF